MRKIKSNELRIGNLIRTAAAVWKVFELSEYKNVFSGADVDLPEGVGRCYQVDLSEAGPILLTDAWLIRLGFDNYKEDYCFKLGHRFFLSVSKPELSVELQVLDTDLKIWLENIQYVHQVQNFCFLVTGNELNVNPAS